MKETNYDLYCRIFSVVVKCLTRFPESLRSIRRVDLKFFPLRKNFSWKILKRLIHFYTWGGGSYK